MKSKKNSKRENRWLKDVYKRQPLDSQELSDGGNRVPLDSQELSDGGNRVPSMKQRNDIVEKIKYFTKLADRPEENAYAAYRLGCIYMEDVYKRQMSESSSGDLNSVKLSSHEGNWVPFIGEKSRKSDEGNRVPLYYPLYKKSTLTAVFRLMLFLMI